MPRLSERRIESEPCRNVEDVDIQPKSAAPKATSTAAQKPAPNNNLFISDPFLRLCCAAKPLQK